MNNAATTDTIEELVVKMNDLIVHRGPDDSGQYVKQNKQYALSMGMRRLAIIDLVSGQQPIFTEDKSKVIVFNGEIYNYKEVRKELIDKGVSFTTESDTEVVLKLYDTYGPDSFGKLDGMFAFSIYDTTIDKLFIARDFFGEKPLYYTHNEGVFAWASELKSLINVVPSIPPISKQAMSLYFQLTYIPAPFSIYEGIHKLEANHYITLDCKVNQFTISSIAQETKRYQPSISFSEAKQTTKLLVRASVESRTVSDVPIGSFLSGGVDSSIVSLCLAETSNKQVDTFSVGFSKKEFDESDKARTVAKTIGSTHHEFIVSAKDIAEDIDNVLLNFDEPFADSSALPTYLVAKQTSNHVKVALTGDGGDEVFGGYNKYYMGALNRKYTSVIPKFLHKGISSTAGYVLRTSHDKRGKRYKANRLLKAIDYDGLFYYNIVSLGFQKEELVHLIKPSQVFNNAIDIYRTTEAKSLTDFRDIDKRMSLEGDMLVKVDRTSMLNSLECRAPFLNKNIWNFTNQVPEKFLMKGWDKKYLLKEAFKEHFPEGFLDKSKQGFGVPVGDWLRLDLKKELLGYIEDGFLHKQQLFQADYIKKIVTDHIDGRLDNTFRVWTFYCFQKWYKSSIFSHEV